MRSSSACGPPATATPRCRIPIRGASKSPFSDPEGNDWEFVQYLSQDPARRNDYRQAGR
jgi:hypothetical protein